MAKGILLDSITKEYRKGDEVSAILKNINLNIESGDIAALYGPSGSGKSTLLNLISGLDKPTSGQITIGSDDVSHLNAQQWTLYRRKNIGFIFQNYNLFSSLNAVENVETISLLNGISSQMAREQAMEALTKVGLGKYINYYPSELSGGQQQRVAVARAIASKPKLILADEPTANLDSQNAKAIIDLLFEMNEHFGTTILFSTHDNEIIKKVKTLIRLKDGNIVDP